MRRHPILSILFLTLAVSLAVGCSKTPREPSGFMDTPGHHFNMGLKLLDRDLPDRAEREFDLALELDEEYPPALAGKALAAAVKGEEDNALDLLDDALDEADDLDEDEAEPVTRAWPAALGLAVWTELYMQEEVDRDVFLDEVEDLHEEALDIHPDSAAARYFAAEAYVAALDFDRAESLFAEVLELDRAYVDKARNRWEQIQAVRRLAPASPIGRKIALVERVTRSEMAALLTEELQVAEFYEATPAPGDKAGFEPPRAKYYESGPYDVEDHPLAESINEVIEYGVKGLEPYPDGSFRPDEPLTRAEAAMIYEDILVRATGDWGLSTKFIGRPGPFRDLGNDHAAFNAAMLATTRGIMSADARTGRFKPGGEISGVEALRALEKLKNELRLFR